MVAGWRHQRDRRTILPSSILFVRVLLPSPSLEDSLRRITKTITLIPCLRLSSSKILKRLKLSSWSPCVQVIVLYLLQSLFKMMTSFFAISQNSMQKKTSRGNLRPCVTRNKSFEETSIASQHSQEAVCSPHQVASLSDVRATEKCLKPERNEDALSSGTKPKTRRTPERSGSSSDDAVFQPHKGRMRYKSKLPEADDSKSVLSKPSYSQSSSSEIDASVIDTRIGRLQGNHKSRYPRTKPNSSVHINSSSSSLSGSTSKPRIPRAKVGQQRSKSPNTTNRHIPPLRRSSSSFHVQKDLVIEEPRYNLRNQSQNTEVMGVDKTFSTIENEAFLRKVEEVLSEIVEQKKRKILDTQRSYSTLKPSSAGRARKRKTSPKSHETWVLSKHFDTSDHKHTFSHIITSHGKGRLRTRSKSSDLLETHEQCFTKLEPYKPRILRKEPICKFLKDKSSVPNKETLSSGLKISAKSTQLIESIRTESPHTDEQKSSTIEDNLTNTTNNTEAEDTCYESENGGSECALDVNFEPRSPSKRAMKDQADASVDSAYTGSREPTPDDPKHLRIRSLQHKLHHREKHMQHKKKIEHEKANTTNQDEVEEKIKLSDNLVDRVKQEIIQEIKVVGIHSDYAITALIDLYKRKYLQISRKQFDIISRDIKYKFGLTDGSFSDSKNSDREIPVESPKKARVKFMECSKQSESAFLVTKRNDSPHSKKSECILPKEAQQLQEVLEKSKSSADNVRWLSQDEILEAKWASQILSECGIGDQSAKILENAKTWEEVAQALGFTSPFFNTVECGHEDIKECEKHCVPNLYGLPSLDFLQTDTEFLPSNTGNDSLDCKEALMALSAQSRRLSSDLSCTKSYKTLEVTDTQGSVEDSPRRQTSNEMTSHSRLASANFTAASSYSQSSQETVINLNCGRSESDEERGQTKSTVTRLNAGSSEHLSQPIAEKADQRIGTSEENLGNSSEIKLSIINSVPPNQSYLPSANSDLLESDDDFFDSPGKSKESAAASDASKEASKDLQDSNAGKQIVEKAHHVTGDVLKRRNSATSNSNFISRACVNTPESTLEPKNSVSPSENITESSTQSSTQNSAQTFLPLSSKSIMPAIVSDNLLPTNDEEARNTTPVNGSLEVDSEMSSTNRDFNFDRKSDSPSIRKDTNAPTSSLEFTDKLVNNLSPTEIEEIYSQVARDDSGTEDPYCKLASGRTVNSVEAKQSVSNSENHIPISMKNGKGRGLRQLSPLSRDLSGSNKDLRVAVSPTQPSLEGKITALAAAYSSQTEDPPEWLAVADDVCKQFDISL